MQPPGLCPSDGSRGGGNNNASSAQTPPFVHLWHIALALTRVDSNPRQDDLLPIDRERHSVVAIKHTGAGLDLALQCAGDLPVAECVGALLVLRLAARAAGHVHGP